MRRKRKGFNLRHVAATVRPDLLPKLGERLTRPATDSPKPFDFQGLGDAGLDLSARMSAVRVQNRGCER